MPAIQNNEIILSRWKRKLESYWVNHFRKHVKVLLYHRVTRLDRDTLKLAVAPEIFESHIKWLKSKFSIITVDDLAELLLNQKKIPTPSVLITFDDGYADNYLEALPVLQSQQAPATFFINTSKLGTSQEFWWDELDRLVFLSNQLPDKITLDSTNSVSTTDRNILFNTLHDLLKYSTPENRSRIQQSLRAQINDIAGNRTTHRIMTSEELEQLAASPLVTIGAHTVNHISLAVQESVVQQYEMLENKKTLESIIRKPVDYFAYPYGTTKDFNDATVQLTKELGFKLSFVNYQGFATATTHPRKIPRILIRNWDTGELARQLNRSF